MSYCRFGEDSNVYLFRDVLGCWLCMNCSLAPEVMEGIDFHKTVAFISLQEVRDHLKKHVEMGDLVPNYAFERIEQEMERHQWLCKRERMMRRSVPL